MRLRRIGRDMSSSPDPTALRCQHYLDAKTASRFTKTFLFWRRELEWPTLTGVSKQRMKALRIMAHLATALAGSRARCSRLVGPRVRRILNGGCGGGAEY